MSRNPAPSRKARARPSADAEVSARSERGTGEVAPTLLSGENDTGGHRPPGSNVDTAGSLVVDEGPARPLLACRGQRYDLETETFVAHALRAQPRSAHAADLDTYVAHTLRAEGFDASEDGTGRGTPLVEAWKQTCGCGHSFTGPLSLPCPSCGQIRDGVTHGDPIPFDTTQITHPENRSNPTPGDPAPTLARHGDVPAIAFSCKDDGGDAGKVAPTLRACNEKESNPNGGGQVAIAFCNTGGNTNLGMSKPGVPPLTTRNGDPGNVAMGSMVRRLTPRECERLQGFPDDYTAISFNGKPAADGPRYKVLGNSMAVPVIRWIGKRIEMVEELK